VQCRGQSTVLTNYTVAGDGVAEAGTTRGDGIHLVDELKHDAGDGVAEAGATPGGGDDHRAGAEGDSAQRPN